MDYNTNLKLNVDVLQRRLTGLKKGLSTLPISDGQYRFMMIYFDTISEYTDKAFDLLNENKYRELLIQLEE